MTPRRFAYLGIFLMLLGALAGALGFEWAFGKKHGNLPGYLIYSGAAAAGLGLALVLISLALYLRRKP